MEDQDVPFPGAEIKFNHWMVTNIPGIVESFFIKVLITFMQLSSKENHEDSYQQLLILSFIIFSQFTTIAMYILVSVQSAVSDLTQGLD